jgi:hypothetical protein
VLSRLTASVFWWALILIASAAPVGVAADRVVLAEHFAGIG